MALNIVKRHTLRNLGWPGVVWDWAWRESAPISLSVVVTCGFNMSCVWIPLACNSILSSYILRLSSDFRTPARFPNLPVRTRCCRWPPWMKKTMSKVHHHFIFAATPSTFVFPSNLSAPFKLLGRLFCAEETQTVLYFHLVTDLESSLRRSMRSPTCASWSVGEELLGAII